MRANKISSIAADKLLPNLEYLDLGHNQLQNTNFLHQIPSIRTLFLDNNQIEYLQPYFPPCLTHLHLQNNHFSYLPCALFALDKLQELGLEWFEYVTPIPMATVFPPKQAPPDTFRVLKELMVDLSLKDETECGVITFTAFHHFLSKSGYQN